MSKHPLKNSYPFSATIKAVDDLNHKTRKLHIIKARRQKLAAAEHVRNCEACQRMKNGGSPLSGLIQSLFGGTPDTDPMSAPSGQETPVKH